MRIGYLSPFKPLKSGISDFSEELVLALKKYLEIVIFSSVKPQNQEITQNFEIHKIQELNQKALRESLDLIVYHVGNNKKYHGEIVDMLCKYPGILELHDFGLHHLAAEKYFVEKGADSYLREVYYCHGEYGKRIAKDFLEGKGRPPWETHSLDLCMNRRYIESASAIILHSEAAKQMTLGFREDVPVTKILLHSEILPDINSWKDHCRAKLKINPNKSFVMGSFGFATTAKRIIPILEALRKYKDTVSSDFLYFIVGEPQKELHLLEEIASRKLENNVEVTGFVDLDKFKTYMGACDFCLNLRYPTQGESSASLHRMFGMGKPAIVTDIGTFSDYPDDIVIKVRYDEHEENDIYSAIQFLTLTKNELWRRSEAALKYAKKYCDLEKNAQRYVEFFHQVHDHIWQPEHEDILIGKLCELGLTDENYTKHIYEEITFKKD